MEWWGVYLNGERTERYLSYVSEERARELSQALNRRNRTNREVFFEPMEIRFLLDEKYKGERIY